MAVREYAYVLAVKRQGVTPGRNLGSGQLATMCPACPHPDINMAPDWENVPQHLQYVSGQQRQRMS